MTTIVDRLHADFRALAEHLSQGAEPSLQNTAEDNFRKALLLAAASYFEVHVTASILAFTRDIAGKDVLVPEFVRRKALSRQYHALFDWDAPNVNKFFHLFGDDFKEHMVKKVKVEASLGTSITAFIEVGRERNRLVHLDFGSYTLEKTADEIYDLYLRALVFVERLPKELTECSEKLKAAS